MTADDGKPSAPPPGLNAFQRGVLVAGLLSQGMGQTMLFATMPPAARDLHLSELQVGLIITVSAFFFMVSTPVWGRLADSWGRRPTFVFGLLSYGITTLLFTVMLDVGYSGVLQGVSLLLALITVRTGFGILTGGIQTGATAMMADSTAAESRSSGMALVGASFGVGAVLGPALVSVLTVYSLLLPLYIVSGLTFAMGIVAWLLLPETAHKHIALARAKVSPLDRRILPIMLMSFATFLCISMHNQSFGFYVQDMLGTTGQATARNAGFGYIAIGIAMIISQGVVVQILKPPPLILLRAGPIIAGIGYALLLQATSIEWLIAAMAVAGFGTGFLQAGVYSAGSLRVTAEEQGATAGLLAAAPAGGFLIGPSLSAVLYMSDHRLPFMVIVAIFATLAVGSWLLRAKAPTLEQSGAA